jgi:hypothetical protein
MLQPFFNCTIELTYWLYKLIDLSTKKQNIKNKKYCTNY